MRKATVILTGNSRGEILLLKRHSDHPLFPNEWGFPGGKVDFMEGAAEEFGGEENIPNSILMYGETDEECIYRETLEETGIHLRAFARAPVVLSDRHYIVSAFVSAIPHEKEEVVKEFPNREHVEYGWFDQDELPEGTSRMVVDLLEALENMANTAIF